MKLQHPETKNIFEVEQAHGEMLLSKGFYKEAPIEKEIEVEAPKPRYNKKIKQSDGE